MSLIESAGDAHRRGPRGRRGEVADVILDAARRQFASDGYAGTTLQAIGKSAGVDTKLVRYYFHDKEALFAACLVVPERFLDSVRVILTLPAEERGEALVRQQLESWRDQELAITLRTILLIAGHEERAMAQVRAFFETGLIAAVEEGLPTAERRNRAALVSSQLLGLSFARHVYKFEQATALTDELVIRAVGRTLQTYLTGTL